QSAPQDFVIATGQQHSVREFVDAAAQELEMTVRWVGAGVDEKGIDSSGRCIVAVDPKLFRPTEVDMLLGDASKAQRSLGWRPKTSFAQLGSEMVREDVRQVRRETHRSATGSAEGASLWLSA